MVRQVLFGTCVLIGLVVFIQSCVRVDDTPPVPDNVRPADQMFVLLVGCTDYPKLKELKDKDTYESKIWLEGPGHDVALMRTTFRDYLGVPDANITTLTGWPADESARPTCANILKALTDMASAARPGDRFVFHYSGHGSQQTDGSRPGDTSLDELDGLDEILLPADVASFDKKSGRVEGSITDDELWAHVVPIRKAGATVWLSLDCCHSGGGMRGGGNRTRGIEPDVLRVPKFAPSSRTHGQLAKAPENTDGGIVATSAAQNYQPASEQVLPKSLLIRNRKYHGLYSFLLARTLQRLGGSLTFAELHEHLVAGYQALPWDKAMPYLQGDTALRVAPHYKRDPNDLRLSQTDAGTWRLNAGAIRGITVDTTLDVFERTHDGTKRVATVRVDEVSMTGSLCSPTDGALRAPKGTPLSAKILKVGLGEVTIPIAVVDAEGKSVGSPLPEAVSKVLTIDVVAHRHPVVNLAEAQWILRIDGAEAKSLQRVAAGAMSPRFEVDVDSLRATLNKIFKAQSLLRLAKGDVSNLPPKLKFHVSTSTTEVGALTPLTPGQVVLPGTYVSASLRNKTDKIVDVTVLFVDSHYGIGVVRPRPGNSVRLMGDEKRKISIKPGQLNDDSLGIEGFLVLAAIRSKASDREIDFQRLAQPPLETARGEQFVETMLNTWLVGEGTRGDTLDVRTIGIRWIPWRTQWGSFHIPPKIRSRGTAVQPTDQRAIGTDSREPWFLGEQVAVLTDKGRARAVVTWNARVEQIYILKSGNEDLSTEAILAQIATETLPTNLTLRLEAGRRSAWYASADRGLDQLFIETDEDERANRRATRQDGTWHEEDSGDYWLTTKRLGETEDRQMAIIERLRDFVRHP